MKNRMIPSLAVVLALLFLLVGCGSSAPVPTPVPTPTPTPVPTPTPTPPPAVPVEPVRVVVGQAQDVRSWDPPADWATAAEWITENAYDYLFVRAADGSGWVPELAKSWELIDELTYRFYLNEGVTFHDGTQLTAEDVKYHYRRIIDGTREQYIVTDQYQWIDEIVIHDPYTFDVVSKERDSLFLWKLSQANTGAGIVSKAYVERVGIDGVHRWPMGSGPWVLKEAVRDEYVLFERNEDYWQQDKFPNFEEFEFRIIPEASTRVAEILTGGVHVIYDVIPQDKSRIDADSNVRTHWSQTARGFMLALRTGARSRTNKPNPDYPDDPELNRYFTTEDPRVREAIELAIDKYQLRDLAGGTGEAFRARTYKPLEEAHPDLYGPVANLYDPDRARELLAEAGYDPGECRVVMHAVESWPLGDMARVVADMLGEVGFTVDLRVLDPSTYTSEINLPGKTQEISLIELGGQMNPFFATAELHTNFRHSILPTTDPDFVPTLERIDTLLDFAWKEVQDNAARVAAYREASWLAAELRSPFVGLFQRSSLWAISNKVEFTPRFDMDIYGYDMKYVR